MRGILIPCNQNKIPNFIGPVYPIFIGKISIESPRNIYKTTDIYDYIANIEKAESDKGSGFEKRLKEWGFDDIDAFASFIKSTANEEQLNTLIRLF